MKRSALLLWGGITFGLWLILALLWYRERVVFVDIAYHLFFLLKDRGFAIQNGRFGAAFTQFFPLVGAALGLSVNFIAALYSASFILLPAIIFGLLLGPLRNARLALAYLLFEAGMMTHTFFWIQSELPQATAFLFLFAGLLEKQLHRETFSAFFLPAAQVLLLVVCFSHPLIPIPFFYLLLFMGLRYPLKRRMLTAVAVSFLLVWILKSLFFRYPYEQQAMSGLKNFVTLFPHYFNLQSNRDYLRYFVHDYYVAGLLLVVLAVYYFRRQAWLNLALLALFFAGFSALVNISSPGGSVQFYVENQYLILGFFVALPAAYDLFESLQKRRYQQLLLGAVVVCCMARITLAHPLYKQRLQWNEDLLARTSMLPDKKIMLPAESAPLDTLLMTWGSSYEFWLLSTLNGGPARSIIIEEKAGEFDADLSQNKAFITKWGAYKYADFKGPYFPFTDTGFYVKWPAGK